MSGVPRLLQSDSSPFPSTCLTNCSWISNTVVCYFGINKVMIPRSSNIFSTWKHQRSPAHKNVAEPDSIVVKKFFPSSPSPSNWCTTRGPNWCKILSRTTHKISTKFTLNDSQSTLASYLKHSFSRLRGSLPIDLVRRQTLQALRSHSQLSQIVQKEKLRSLNTPKQTKNSKKRGKCVARI